MTKISLLFSDLMRLIIINFWFLRLMKIVNILIHGINFKRISKERYIDICLRQTAEKSVILRLAL